MKQFWVGLVVGAVVVAVPSLYLIYGVAPRYIRDAWLEGCMHHTKTLDEKRVCVTRANFMYGE